MDLAARALAPQFSSTLECQVASAARALAAAGSSTIGGQVAVAVKVHDHVNLS